VMVTGQKVFPVCCILLAACLTTGSPVLGSPDLPGPEDVPYGIASDYLVGRQLLKEGQFAEALGFLHLVYRTHPNVPTVALDFKDALVAEGYFEDAVQVMDKLITAYPDSLSYLLQRGNLNIKLGKVDKALDDLRAVREKGGSSLEIIIAEANLLGSRGDLDQALDVYRDGLELFPDQGGEIFLGMAALLQRAGKQDEVSKLLEEGVGKYPDNPDLWLVWLRSLAATGKHDQALEVARRADALFLVPATGGEVPEDGSAPGEPLATHVSESFLVELADFYVQQGQVNRGLGILEDLAASGTLDLTPSLWLARIYLGTGRTQQGQELVDSILERWPESGRAWFLKGKILENQENWPQAISLFDKAVSLSPHDPEIRLALLRAMLVGWEKDLSAREPGAEQLARREQVEKQAVAALTLVAEGDSEGQLVLGYAFRTLQDPWRAERCFELAAADPENRISADTQRSLCFDEMGEPGKARRVLEELHKAYPEHPEVANSLGYFLAEKGEDLDKALELVRIALTAQPGNGAFLDSMGWVLFRQGQTESAFDYLIQAVNVLPDDPVILEHLGMALLEMGQREEALGMLRRSLDLGGDKERISAILGRLEEETVPAAEPAPENRQQ